MKRSYHDSLTRRRRNLKVRIFSQYLPHKACIYCCIGSADFFAIDLYTSTYVAAPPNGINACLADSSDVNWPQCNVGKLFNSETNWPIGIAAEAAATWLRATPQFVRYELGEMFKRWPSKKIVRQLSAYDQLPRAKCHRSTFQSSVS